MPNQKVIAFVACTDSPWLSGPTEKAIQNAGGRLLSFNTGVDSSFTPTHESLGRADIIVVDLTKSSPDAMYSVGLAQALGKPIIPLVNSFADLPSSLRSIQSINIGEFEHEQGFTNRLTNILSDVLKNPAKYSYEKLLEEQKKKQTIFISYSHSDKELLDRLLVHLRPLQKQGLLELWADTHLRAGDKWKDEIERALERATAAVLIISADFLASDFVVDNELPPLLKGAEEKGTRIIPLIAKPCRFTRDPNLNNFQSINDPKEALVLLDKGNQERVFDALCAQVERHLNKA